MRHDLLDEYNEAYSPSVTSSAFYADPYDFVWFAYDSLNYEPSTQLIRVQLAMKMGVTPRKYLMFLIKTPELILKLSFGKARFTSKTNEKQVFF